VKLKPPALQSAETFKFSDDATRLKPHTRSKQVGSHAYDESS
jgi:hypothetical protein